MYTSALDLSLFATRLGGVRQQLSAVPQLCKTKQRQSEPGYSEMEAEQERQGQVKEMSMELGPAGLGNAEASWTELSST